VESAPIREWNWSGHRGRRSRGELLDFTLTGEATMTEDRLPLNELLQKAGDGDFLRAVAESVLQLLMEADV
jgi:putative transposase